MNPNTGKALIDDDGTELVASVNTVHHNAVNASHVLLPVVPLAALPPRGVLLERAVGEMMMKHAPEKRAALLGLGESLLKGRYS